MGKIIHFLNVPFTGLGLYGGYRGDRWLKNRIKVFKQFVIPSLKNQTSKNFVLWISWRHEEKFNPIVRELIEWLKEVKEFKTVHTFHGVCFYDDKYNDDEAKNRLVTSLHGSIGELLDVINDADTVLVTIQPSDDCYVANMISGMQRVFNELTHIQSLGFTKGYIMNYSTQELAEYNPSTNPPFFTIKFPKDIFIEPLKHAEYISIKKNVGKYKAGTPYPSHEYVIDALNFGSINERGFIVGTHGENISTVFNHPFKGRSINGQEKYDILKRFGLLEVKKLELKTSLRKWILRQLPFKCQRMIRYWIGERIWQNIYNFLRK